MTAPNDEQQRAPAPAGSPPGLKARHRRARLLQSVFLSATIVGILGLTALLYNVINDSIGLVAYEQKVDPASLSDRPLEDLPPAELIDILVDRLRPRQIDILNAEKPLAERSAAELRQLVAEHVLGLQVVGTWPLVESLLRRSEIEAELAASNPRAVLEFQSWVRPAFLANAMSSQAALSGVRTALLGSLWMISLTLVIAFPVGVGAAIYLEEYAGHGRLTRIIQTNIDNLAGVPSIVYGMLGLAIFVRGLERYTSGAAFGVDGANGRTILSAALTMALLVLPILIINAQEAIRAVPSTLRLASYGLGATRWQTIWSHVLPSALPGILTGTILAVSRAVGETAPLIVIGASTFITVDPSGPFSKFTVLPIQIYTWTSRAQGEFHNLAAAAIVVLLALLLSLNAGAVVLRNRFSRQGM